MKLSIVIPALNEEAAIASIIERTLAARRQILAGSPVTEVEVVVVSDGSTDRTAEIAADYASRHANVRLIVFPMNRGYGAAIKRGFEESSGELVAFLDADGTCDPRFFAVLCRAIVEEGAAVALGSRLGTGSRMPRVRRIGNRVYALILGLLSNRVVTDTASGMRVLRRSALEQLYPLPDRLNFTPALSARVLMDDELTIVERPMPYEERIGESKLHVLRDGVGFLRTIFEMALMWQPAKMFFVAAFGCFALMVLLGAHPVEAYVRSGRLAEDMIYRLLFCSWLGTLAATLLSAGVLCERLAGVWRVRRHAGTFLTAMFASLYTIPGLALASTLVLPASTWLVGRGIWTRITGGYVDLHWSRIVLGGLLAFCWLQMFVTTMVVNVIRFHEGRASSRPQAFVRRVRTTTRAGVEREAARGPLPRIQVPIS